jgi:hypothetical protein
MVAIVSAALDLMVGLVFSMAGRSLSESARPAVQSLHAGLHMVSLLSEVVLFCVVLIAQKDIEETQDQLFLGLSFASTLASFVGNVIGLRFLLKQAARTAGDVRRRLSSHNARKVEMHGRASAHQVVRS